MSTVAPGCIHVHLLHSALSVLEMSTEELGTPAYHKYDIEVWMPGRGCYGEVTSASNCTDYQSRRLNVKYPRPKLKHNESKRTFVHTVSLKCCTLTSTRSSVTNVSAFEHCGSHISWMTYSLSIRLHVLKHTHSPTTDWNSIFIQAAINIMLC